MDAGSINFLLYEDGSEYLGTASIQFNEMTNKTFTVNGAGIPGDINLPVVGHKDAMTITINFTDVSDSTYKLAEERVHQVDLRIARENYDSSKGQIGVRADKHILKIIPTALNSGNVSPANPQGASGTYSVLSREDYLDGKRVLKYDPVNFVDIDISGTDRLQAVRSALGK